MPEKHAKLHGPVDSVPATVIHGHIADDRHSDEIVKTAENHHHHGYGGYGGYGEPLEFK